MTRLPSLGPRGEGWVLAQGPILVVVVAAGTTGPAWGGIIRLVAGGIGIALMVGGIALATRGVADLGGGMTPLPRPVSGARLVDRGAYRLVRHPIYGGLVIAGVGWGLTMAAPIAIAASLVLLAFFSLKSRREEAWLRDALPGYGEYARRTRRLIPYVY